MAMEKGCSSVKEQGGESGKLGVSGPLARETDRAVRVPTTGGRFWLFAEKKAIRVLPRRRWFSYSLIDEDWIAS